MSCSTCTGVIYASTIQTANRSASDYTSFVGGRALFAYVNNVGSNYTRIDTLPKFHSHADYLRYQRLMTQLNAVPLR